MLPLYGSFPHHRNQPQPQSQSQSQSSSQPNSVPSQPQLGMNNNSQIPLPFNGVAMAMAMPNMPNSMANQPGFMNGPNSHVGMAHLGSIGPIPQPGKPRMGSNMSPVAPAFQAGGFGHNNNMLSLQQFSQNGPGFPFGQLCVPMPNAMQGTNQFAATQMLPNLSQYAPHNAFGPQAGVPQNPGFVAIPQFGNLHYNQFAHHHLNNYQQNLLMPGMDINAPNPSPVVAQQFRGNSATTVTNSNQAEQTNNNLQPFGAQGNSARSGGFNASRGNWKDQSNKNFTRNPKRGMQQGGSHNSQFHPMRNGRKNFEFPNGRNGRGRGNEKPAKFGTANFKNQGREPRKSIALTYTEQEIRQWREARRKNYPSKGNIEKKLAKKVLNKEDLDKEAKLRQEQLKEILAKQAELGVEVAEIPGCYLSDTKKVGQQRGENGRPFGKNGRFQNRFDKRGRYDKKDWHSKKQRLNDNASSNVPSLSTRKPTLLEKLLLPQIKRDNSHLLQALRFVVLNNFFDGPSNKPLKFPTVVFKDGSGEDVLADEVCLNAGKDVPEASNKTVVGEVGCDEDKESGNNANDSDRSDDDGSSDKDENKDNGESDRERQDDEETGEEEEGEIIN